MPNFVGHQGHLHLPGTKRLLIRQAPATDPATSHRPKVNKSARTTFLNRDLPSSSSRLFLSTSSAMDKETKKSSSKTSSSKDKRPKDKDKDKAKDESKVHKLSLKGSSKLVAEFVCLNLCLSSIGADVQFLIGLFSFSPLVPILDTHNPVRNAPIRPSECTE